MRRTCLLLMVYCMCCAGQLMAQNVSGKVVDVNHNPLPFVGVTLHDARDSSFVCGVATDHDGLFSVPARAIVSYLLSASFVGYETVQLVCRAGDIGEIVMKEDSRMLDEVVVVASRTRHDATGYSVNLRSSKIATGKPAADALTFLPGVSLEDGNYKINGLQVSEIYVDGVKLASKDELKNIPAEFIDKVKVNYLAGVNHNAAEVGGTIAITLRKPATRNYYGSLWGGAEYHPSYGFSDENTGGVIYYRHNKLSLYNHLSLDFFHPQETATQTIGDPTTDEATKIDVKLKSRSHAFKNRLSLTHNMSDERYLGASYYIATNKTKDLTRDNDATVLSSVDDRTSFVVQEATLKYHAAIGGRGTTLEMIGDYFNRQSDRRSNYAYGTESSANSKDETRLNMWKFSADLTTPCGQKLTWNYGASVKYISSKYTPLVDAAGDDERFLTSQTPTRTRGLAPLIFASAKGQLWKVQYSAGINFRLNRIWFEALDDGTTSTSTRWGLNPTVQLMMPLGSKGKHTVMLNYKRTLGDIPYSAISSTIRWIDSYNYTVGNPDLKAPTIDFVMAGVSLFGNLLSLNAVYSHSRNSIYWETKQSANAPDVFYTTPINLPAHDAFGAGGEVNWNPWDPWTVKLSGRCEIHPEDVSVGGVYYGKTRVRQYYAMNNSFSFRHGWGGMLTLSYEPTFKNFDRTYYTVWGVDARVHKSLCDDKLQLSLTLSLLGDRRKYDSRANGRTITYDYTTPVQSEALTVRWMFSGGKSRKFNVVNMSSQDYDEVRDTR